MPKNHPILQIALNTTCSIYFKTNSEILYVKIILHILHPLKATIGVMSPYTAQVERLNLEIKKLKEKLSGLDIEASTIDGYQGREKDIIIVSMVRSNDENKVGFIADKERINVAITRARKLVIIVGDSSTICTNQFLFDLVNFIVKNGKRFRIKISSHQTKSLIDISEIIDD